MKNIKNIVFDFGGVLLDIDVKHAIDNMKKLVGISDNTEIVPKNFIPILNAYEVGAINTETFVWKLQYMSKTKHHAVDYIKAWNSMLIGMKFEKFEKLLKLGQNYNVYLLSNINDLHLDWIYRYFKKEFGIVDWDNKYFINTYYSHLIHRRKPDVSTFEFVWNDANIDPIESLFIDDMIDNIEAASSIGIHTLHHDPNKDVFDCLQAYFGINNIE